jgi:SAM-dependent methyltransferase
MPESVDLYDTSYSNSNFRGTVHERVRLETYGQDLGQTSWMTAGECREFLGWLGVKDGDQVLDVACGAGNVALFIATTSGATVLGIDINENGLATARESAGRAGRQGQVRFQRADADLELPFPDGSFDAIICIDAASHFRDRRRLLADWRRVLKPKGRLLYTDPLVVSGQLTREEMVARSSLIDFFVFTAIGANERFIAEAGLKLLRHEDHTQAIVQVSRRWLDARQRWRDELVAAEGEAAYEGLQRFLEMANRLPSEGRLTRHVFMAERPN